MTEAEVNIPGAPSGGSGQASKQTIDGPTRALFERAVTLLREDRAGDASEQALVALREARDLAPDHAQIRSYLGLAIARSEKNFAEARELCEDAAKQEFFNPDVYLNLAKVYLCFGRRAEALRYLRRGQMIDPGHAPIKRLIAGLGHRKLPILPFLPRRHPINRALGTARTKLAELFSRS